MRKLSHDDLQMQGENNPEVSQAGDLLAEIASGAP